ncbi:MAG TPA: BA14K family protein [Aestuariivirga sp.]|nr:BA14K family protein [Aestuariivirga sp.]
MKNSSLVLLGAVLGFGTMALTGGGASAAALLPLSPLASSQQNAADGGMIQLAASKSDRRMRTSWERHRDGRRCSSRFGNCRHFHRGYYYETPWWTLPLIIGGGIAANNYDDDYDDDGGYGSRHVEWCLDRYRSYDPRTNTWVSYSGNVNECNSPYG